MLTVELQVVSLTELHLQLMIQTLKNTFSFYLFPGSLSRPTNVKLLFEIPSVSSGEEPFLMLEFHFSNSAFLRHSLSHHCSGSKLTFPGGYTNETWERFQGP